MKPVVYIPGDGIGPSCVDAARRIIDASGAPVQWIQADAGMAAFEHTGQALPQATLDLIREHKTALKGPLTTPVGQGFRSINVALRQEFELYVNLRPVKSFDGVHSRYSNIDLVIFRENTEGLYSGVEHYIDHKKSAAESTAIITRAGSERIARAAFRYAALHGRKKVTIVHKANILKYTSGMFLEVCRQVGQDFPSVITEDKIVDNMAMQMVLKPEAFDVIVTTNLFGDILSDLASGLVGGLGLAPGANIGDEVAIFEAVHGSAPDIAGKNTANPSAVVLAGTMMLRHLDMAGNADLIERALADVIRQSVEVTKDLNPDGVGTTQMTDAIITRVRSLQQAS